MTLTDMANYKIYSRPTASITYRGYKLFSCGAPSSGAVALSTFKTIEGYTDMSDPSLLNLSTHRLDEALRFAYAAHNELGDPEFVDEIDVYAFEKEMLEESTAREIRARISDEKTREVRWYNPRGLKAPDTHGTSHVVSADGEGMSVSLTTTVNTLFGSGVLEPETGEFDFVTFPICFSLTFPKSRQFPKSLDVVLDGNPYENKVRQSEKCQV